MMTSITELVVHISEETIEYGGIRSYRLNHFMDIRQVMSTPGARLLAEGTEVISRPVELVSLYSLSVPRTGNLPTGFLVQIDWCPTIYTVTGMTADDTVGTEPEGTGINRSGGRQRQIGDQRW